jgi:hypothetical protein
VAQPHDPLEIVSRHWADSKTEISYLSDVDQASHQILVAKLSDSLLSLFSRCIFHNSTQFVSFSLFLQHVTVSA